MLKTPFGEIKIFKNRKEVKYVAEAYDADIFAAKDKPLAGCYRVYVDFEENDTIVCELWSNDRLVAINSEEETGEDYICCHLQKDNVKLTIGTSDTIN
ncbi:MAG: hypothetical protein J6Q15_02900, partial [Clostridia bacterium]|nr:hypothetical protein [Clostridia bacterium]